MFRVRIKLRVPSFGRKSDTYKTWVVEGLGSVVAFQIVNLYLKASTYTTYTVSHYNASSGLRSIFSPLLSDDFIF